MAECTCKGNCGCGNAVHQVLLGNLQGKQGEQGKQGKDGKQGATGRATQGERGFQGKRGFQGETGKQGIQGEKGEIGNSWGESEVDSFLDELNTKFDNNVDNINTHLDLVDSKQNATDSELIEINIKQEQTTEKLADAEEKNPNNAKYPLMIRTYDGFNRTVHPDVVYFDAKWNGFHYWMVHTPFPFDNDFWENPSIVVSNDGVKWDDAPGISNPIDEVTEEENEAGIYLSDAVLVFVNNRLECFYRWFDATTREERFYRQYSNNGADWLGKEVIIDKAGTALGMMLSPSIVYENGKYRMWVVDNPNRRVMYTESTNAKDWTAFKEIPLSFSGRETEPWHLDVYKENTNLFHLVFSEYKSGNQPRSIFHGTSKDGMNFEDVTEIMKTSKGSSWDNRMLYRASLVKVGGRYKLYYSAKSSGTAGGAWRVGLVEGDSVRTMHSTGNYGDDLYFHMPRVSSENTITDTLEVESIVVETTKEKTPSIKLLRRGATGVSLKTGKSNTLYIENDKGDGAGDIEVRKIIVDGLELFTSGNTLKILKAGAGLVSFEVSKIQTSVVTPVRPSLGVTMEGKVSINTGGTIEPSLKLLSVGKSGAELKTTGTDTIEIVRDNGNIGGHLKAGSIILEGASRGNIEGSIRFNSSTKKHQGFDGTSWNDMY